MALPLTPEMFPDTLVEPFVVSQEVADLADDVIASFDEFEPIQTAIRDAGLAIAYVFETRPFDPAKEELKPHTIAKVTKASPLWLVLGGHELVIQFRQAFWDLFDANQRRAVLHHELTHIEIDEPGNDGRVKLSLRPHDVEEFARTMRRFGPILPSRAGLVKAYLDWQHEQESPAPTPLRNIGREVMDRVVDMVNAGAMDDTAKGVKVTATRPRADA
ncbi:MAG: putative metallopeptidase [Chloroflexota bacterium]